MRLIKCDECGEILEEYDALRILVWRKGVPLEYHFCTYMCASKHFIKLSTDFGEK